MKIRRINIAERLYRVTGAGIYRDSLLVGRKAPIHEPLLNAQVFGSDSVVNTVYKQKVYWFWGDTNRPEYPLGNFNVPGATSDLPQKGGLSPDIGIDLTYFTNKRGFAKPMAPIPGAGPTWIHGLFTLKVNNGHERLFAAYMKVRGFLNVYERGLAEFNDDKLQFEKVVAFPTDAYAQPGGHPVNLTENGQEYIYFANPYPLVRVPANLESIKDASQYEAFSCLVPGTRVTDHSIDRTPTGAIRYAWKKETEPIGPHEQAKLLSSSHLKTSEALLHLQDVNTGKLVLAHAGSVYWNPYRSRWVMITHESGRTSALGEVWFAEADTLLGPWVYAQKIVTHDKYSFYNVKQHPMFDQQDGQIIYFEGTYTHTFSGNNDQTPRYDYNQIMYKLNLTDPRLALPVAIYDLPGPDGSRRFSSQRPSQLDLAHVAFFAPTRPSTATLPIYQRTIDGITHLFIPEEPAKFSEKPLFYALSAKNTSPSLATVPLYEFIQQDTKKRLYSVEDKQLLNGYLRSPEPLCSVWRNPAPGVSFP